MDERVSKFRDERGRRLTAGQKKVRYPEDVKALAVSYAESKRAEGVSVYQSACDLGVGVQTLTSWIEGKPARPPRSFRQVEVVPDMATSMATGGLTLRTANGHTVGGLDMPTLVRLVRELDGR